MHEEIPFLSSKTKGLIYFRDVSMGSSSIDANLTLELPSDVTRMSLNAR